MLRTVLLYLISQLWLWTFSAYYDTLKTDHLLFSVNRFPLKFLSQDSSLLTSLEIPEVYIQTQTNHKNEGGKRIGRA